MLIACCSMLVAFTKDGADAQYIRTNWVSGSHGTTYIIETKEELEEYLTANMEEFGLQHKEKVYADTTIGFEDAIQKYDEEFFKNNNLVLVLLTAESGSIRHKVNSANIADGVMTINITRQTKEYQTCDMAGWHIIIETEKVSIDKIVVYEEGKEITK